MNLVDGRQVERPLRRSCDVVVVGSGPAGAAVARTVATSGMSVVVVEEGHWMGTEDIEADAFGAMAAAYRDMGASVTRGRAPMPYLQGRAVGGGSVINGAISWRLPRDVYDEWCRQDPTLGGSLCWEEIEAAHDEVEERLHISPTASEVSGANNDLLARGAEELGLEHRRIRRNTRGCEGLGRCLQGCPRGHKQSMDQTYLRDACGKGAEIVSGARVDEIIVASDGASGVAGRTCGGARFFIRAAEAVVVAAGAVQTPLLLWNNKIRQGPVGEYFQCHPGVSMTGRFDEPVRIWTGATQGHEVTGLRREGIKFEALGYDMAVAATRQKGVGRAYVRQLENLDYWAGWGAAIRAEARGRVRPGFFGSTRVCYDPTPKDMIKLRRGLTVLGQMMLAAGARYVTPGVYGFDEVVRSPERMAEFGREGSTDPRDYQMVTTHLFGTCRMGSDRSTSVVGHDFEHHAIRRLYIADASVFPSNTGVNPQTSIIALATICGRRIAVPDK